MESKTQTKLFGSDKGTASKQPVECLGITFPNDRARQQYFLEKLKEKLKDPSFRRIEGFPTGADDDILALSDPPYYTACPNPFIADFIKSFGTPYNPNDLYSREPFIADVSEGKNDPIYKAHQYHTKVPHKAIMRYILHYTKPGDMVFDGFCGSGMTGVAATLCGDRNVLISLGYQVKPDGTVLRQESDEDGNLTWTAFSSVGARRALLNDLSPAATFIAYNYNAPVDAGLFQKEAEQILKEVEKECGWMYETKHPDGRIGNINYTVWSDVFICPDCTGDITFWDVAVDKTTWQVADSFSCPHCTTELSKRALERKWVSVVDPLTKQAQSKAMQIPVLIHYKLGGVTHTKKPDKSDLDLLRKTDQQVFSHWFPSETMPDGYNTAQPKNSHGISRVHEVFTNRALAAIASYAAKVPRQRHLIHLTSSLLVLSKLYRFRSQGGNLGAGGGPMNGTLYVPSLIKEIPVLKVLREHIERAPQSALRHGTDDAMIACSSLSQMSSIESQSADYIFIDPPFGANINYSELNCIWEAWLRVFTNNTTEAIENVTQHKTLREYQRLMTACFREAYRILKPGRWATVEFSNTQAAVWNSIQTALTEAGFVVANVSALDKQQGSFKAVTTPTAVKQDLIISAYRPGQDLEEKFKLTGGGEDSAWMFVRSHLRQLPKFVHKEGRLQIIAERQANLLYDRMIAFHVQRGYTVPLSSAEFQAGLREQFPERDDMYFLPEQTSEYDRKRLEVKDVEQYELFVNDEKSAIEWVRRQLSERPMKYQDLSPLYMMEAQRVWEKHEQPLELRTILEQNFVAEQDGTWRIADPRKESDLEQLRNRALIKEFQQCLASKGKLKVVRMEALRAGFRECWQKKDYTSIIQMAKRVPEAVIQEDPALLMYFDNASLLLDV